MIDEHYQHDICPKCDSSSEPAEGVPDQALRECPQCNHVWFEDLSQPANVIGHDQDGEEVGMHSTGNEACPAVHGGVCPIKSHNE